MGEFAPDVWEQLEPQHSDFGLRVDSITHEDLWNILGYVGIDEVDSLKLDCEEVEYVVVSELSALGLTDHIGRIRDEWRSREDNLLLANCLGQTHAFHIVRISRTKSSSSSPIGCELTCRFEVKHFQSW